MKKVLAVGMLDSVHLARWLSQFNDPDLEITVFPSTRFRYIHSDLKSLIQRGNINYYTGLNKKMMRFAGYIDFLRFELPFAKAKNPLRGRGLRRYLGVSNVDIVHLIELQHAGYLYLESNYSDKRTFKIISTNYGSDLVFFLSNPDHKNKLIKLLQQSDFYSAECRRDYHLAATLGFKGVELPLIPNAGGFSEDILNQSIKPLRDRKIIYVKGYGEQFGLGYTALKVADRLLDKFSHLEVVVFSLTDDLRKFATKLQRRHGQRFKIHGIRDRISRDQILSTLRQSIVCIGASQSDGISTTFLEALVSGAIPIQTNTSCANEWTEKGFFARVVPPIEEEIFNAASEVLENSEIYEAAVLNNLLLSKSTLSSATIGSIAHSYYGMKVGETR